MDISDEVKELSVIEKQNGPKDMISKLMLRHSTSLTEL